MKILQFITKLKFFLFLLFFFIMAHYSFSTFKLHIYEIIYFYVFTSKWVLPCQWTLQTKIPGRCPTHFFIRHLERYPSLAVFAFPGHHPFQRGFSWATAFTHNVDNYPQWKTIKKHQAKLVLHLLVFEEEIVNFKIEQKCRFIRSTVFGNLWIRYLIDIKSLPEIGLVPSHMHPLLMRYF